jgi:hypothetical protein
MCAVGATHNKKVEAKPGFIKSFIWIMMIRLPYSPTNLLLQCNIFGIIKP